MTGKFHASTPTLRLVDSRGRELERHPPHNLEAEQALLGAIFLNNEALDRVSGFLTPEHFFDPLHGRIYEKLTTLIHAGRPATPVTVKTFFENAEPIDAQTSVPQYLGRLAANATTVINAAEYGRTVYDLATRLSLILIGEDMVNVAYDSGLHDTAPLQVEHAEARLGMLVHSGDHSRSRIHTLESIRSRPLSNYVVKGVINAGEVGILFAVSQAGKGFLGNELAWSLTHGHLFMGRRTATAAVLQVQYEGQSSIAKRISALIADRSESENSTFSRRFVWMDGPHLGRGAVGDSGEAAILRAVKVLEQRSGLRLGLLTIDTVAKAIAGESANDDDAIAALHERARRIAAKTGAAVMLVMHPGHGDKSRPAGSYQSIGSSDFVLGISVSGAGAGITIPTDAARTVTLMKAKDGACGVLGRYRLGIVDVGLDEDGGPLTSCKVVWEGVETVGLRGTNRLNWQALLALQTLDRVAASSDTSVPDHPALTGSVGIVEVEVWRAACANARLSKGNPDSEDRAFRRATAKLLDCKLIEISEGWCQRISQKAAIGQADNFWTTSGHERLSGRTDTDTPLMACPSSAPEPSGQVKSKPGRRALT